MSQIPNNLNYASSWDSAGTSNPTITRFFNAVYAWMCAGLGVTAAVAWFVAQSPSLALTFLHSWLLLLIVEIALVMVISRAVNKVSTNVATLLFLVFAAVNGLTLSVIFLIYAHATLASAFIISAGTFGALSVYGFVTKRDLTAAGRILYMLLIGLVIASVVSLFWHNSAFQVIFNYVGVIVFAGLTAYDTQKLKAIAEQTQGDPAMASRLSIVGSLSLYLDFINLFLFILEVMNDRRR
jgi:FtsH-binding integral membrane protein